MQVFSRVHIFRVVQLAEVQGREELVVSGTGQELGFLNGDKFEITEQRHYQRNVVTNDTGDGVTRHPAGCQRLLVQWESEREGES